MILFASRQKFYVVYVDIEFTMFEYFKFEFKSCFVNILSSKICFELILFATRHMRTYLLVGIISEFLEYFKLGF